MTSIKPGDVVTLKSGGPIMTIDAVNTDIFDDHKITGVVCVWFVGRKLERVRFDHRAIEPAAPEASRRITDDILEDEHGGDYRAVLDQMGGAMNGAPKSTKKTRIRKIKATPHGEMHEER